MPCAQAQREVLSGIVVADQNASVLISKQENRDWHHPVVVMECQSFVPLLRLPNSLLQIMRSDSGYCARVCKRCCCGQCRNVTLLLIGWMLLCTVVVPYVYEVETQEDEVHFVTTPDGWRIALSRYRPQHTRGKDRGFVGGAPVILCHGAFANRITYDLGRGRPSLAVHLSERGHDVWSLELRGHGRSQKDPFLPTVLAFFPGGNQAGGNWSLMEYIANDLPAAVNYVKNYTNARKVHYVGHSMGGIILYSWLAFAMRNSEMFASIVTLGSALDHSKERASPVGDKEPSENMNSTYHALYVPRGLRSPGPAPFAWLNALFAPLAGGPLDPFLGFQYSASSMAPGDARRLLSNNFEAEPWQVVFEIHTVFSKALGMIHPVTKEPLLPRLNNSLPVPLLAFAGECDLQFSTAAVARTAHHLAAVNSNQYVRVVVPGHGTEVCYGHYDLLLGRHAHEHVFKPLERWLNEVNVGQHWYPPEYYEKLPGPVVPLPPRSAAAPHAAAPTPERGTGPPARSASGVEAEAAPGQGGAGGDAVGGGTGGQTEL